MSSFTYPPAPPAPLHDVTAPSPEFRKNVARVVTHIALFALLYLVLLAAGIALAALLVTIGGFVVIYIHHILAIIFGIGLMGVGVMVCIFLIKFLFASKKETVAGAIEATEAEYPDLFRFIRQVSEETGTLFPKHIYIAPEVNAFVSYDSNIRSLLFPVRKNLTIGLGLVNMVNLSEFKAILAHEFGHFSQKSMRAGSYVYQVNKVIYNLLYENEGFGKALSGWASIHSAFALCANMTIKIIAGIQYILREAYKGVNKSYMSLSRQMEFHADAVAARSAGSNNIIHALRRIEFADACYDQTIAKYNAWIAKQYKATNLFSQQKITAQFIADSFRLPLSEGLPLLHEADKHYQTYSRLNIDNQWASHPTRGQREEALNAIGIAGPVVDEPAWILFGGNAEKLQEQVTNDLYKGVQFEKESLPLDDATYTEEYRREQVQDNFPETYQGYFNNRQISVLETDQIIPALIPDLAVFFEQHKDLPAKLNAARADIDLLEQVADKANGISYFDFEGQKYARKDTETVKETIRHQLADQEAALKVNDEKVFAHFSLLALQRGEKDTQQLKSNYRDYYEAMQIADDNIKACEQLVGLLRPISDGGSFSQETALKLCSDLKAGLEAFNRHSGQLQIQVEQIKLCAGEELPEKAVALRNKSFNYIADNAFLDDEFRQTWEGVVALGDWSGQLRFHAQKKLLEQQLALTEPAASLTQAS